MNYHDIAFTDNVKAIQEQNGSRQSYAKMHDRMDRPYLDQMAIQMIKESNSFYMASMGTNDFPYIQHRGGPKGFLKVLDDNTLAFIDFSGNKQYISIGNFQSNNKVALFLMDYARRARLKLYAEVEIKEIEEEVELMTKLDLGEYNYLPERIIVLHIKAFDWNCPQHITPRFTQEDLDEYMTNHKRYTATLEEEVMILRTELKQYKTDKL
ncbi:pyridoxamine 5'-phosphate oxidase family protein [Reichenbachiella versicolor]|uniref:pyridoxamine 5'-phosphate oxidase family protein n=1 Tax=Reichenbachiella versicolor TaxID=1821036 RepID=UPI000D6DE875|nr:pyridoxamine 5'-phosphate oxidase family protein [Reichenbachiella versicolor]